MANIKDMNKALYQAAIHLLEAGKYLSNVEEFREESNVLLNMAESISTIIKPEPIKISEDKMKNILNEIITFGEK